MNELENIAAKVCSNPATWDGGKSESMGYVYEDDGAIIVDSYGIQILEPSEARQLAHRLLVVIGQAEANR